MVVPRGNNPNPQGSGGGGHRHGVGKRPRFKRHARRRAPVAIAAQPSGDVLQLFFDNSVTEMRESMLSYVKSEAPITEISVPGDTRLYKKRSDQARRSTSQLVAWFCDLIVLGWSLDGDIKADDFGVDHLGYLKGNRDLLQKLKKLNETMMDKNMEAAADIIELAIHSGSPKSKFPEDLVDLIDNLRRFDKGYIPLLISHICHETEATKSAVFVKMYNRLMVLKESNITAYSNIINAIPYDSVWPNDAILNAHLANVLRYDGRKFPSAIKTRVSKFLSATVKFDSSAAGLLDHRRNGEAHLEKDYSVDPVQGYLEAALIAALAVQPGLYPQPLPKILASQIGGIVSDVLILPYNSVEEAKQAATAAAISLSQAPNPYSQVAQTVAMNAAAAAANAAAAAANTVLQPAVAQAQPPGVMFTAEQIEHMFDVTAPQLLVRFQRAMFDEWETYKLDDGFKVARLFSITP